MSALDRYTNPMFSAFIAGIRWIWSPVERLYYRFGYGGQTAQQTTTNHNEARGS